MNIAEDRCRTPRGVMPDALYSSSEFSFVSKGVGGPLLALRADGGLANTGDSLALPEADKDLRTDSRLKPFRKRSKLSYIRAAAALALVAFFSTTFLARDGLER
jgi:hypothetical protein